MIPAGTQIIISLRTFVNQALLNSTDTFILEVFTDGTRRYTVQKISSGLTLFTCDPGYYLDSSTCRACPLVCKTCLSATVCLSCYDTAASPPFYHLGNCYSMSQCALT
jgi:hypothetical protein